MNVAFPFRTDGLGRLAASTDDDHIRDLIEQVLFTTPGERVNRPTFGSGLLQMVFAPLSDEIAAALQFVVESSLTQWLGDLIQVIKVEATSDDSTLQVTVSYVIRRTEETKVAELTFGGGR
jgi:hypothetical protein